MRLRNIPRARDIINTHSVIIRKPEEQKGCWSEVFGNRAPVYVEIGMGKGQFLLTMAMQHPEINFVGIERYSSVLLRAVELYDTEKFCGLQNVRFICMDARELANIFAPGEAGRIYLNFSDPWPKARHAKRRLTCGEFLSLYDQVLAPRGQVEFKTDNTELFRFSLEQAREAGWQILAHTYDLHHNGRMNRGNIMTEYEEKFSAKGNPVNKMIITREKTRI